MSQLAKTSLAAMTDVRRALSDFEQAAVEVQQKAQRGLTAVGEVVAAALTERRRTAEAAAAALVACRREPEADCSTLAAAAARAEERLAAAQRAMRMTTRATASLQPALARLGRETNEAVREGVAVITAARSDAEQYLGGSSGGPAATATAKTTTAPASSGDAKPIDGAPGFADVPIGSIDTSDRSIEPKDFTKGYSPEDLKWAYDALHEVVLPAMAGGRGADYFRARDAAEGGRQGTRSYADTYAGFFGVDSIRLERRGGSYAVTNGYHRIWVARQYGLPSVPARVIE